MVVSVLARYFTKLWKLTSCLEKRMSQNEMAGHIGVPPYFLGEYISALQTYGASEIHRAFAALLAADMELKGGTERGERLILTLALGRLCARIPAFS